MGFFSKNESEEDRREKLITFGRALAQKLGRPLKASDFSGEVNSRTIYSHFGKFSHYFDACGSTKTVRLRTSDPDSLKEFLVKIREINSVGCWTTTHYSTKKERLQIKYQGRSQFIYRVSYQLWKGEIPSGIFVLHSCDNEKCYNPEHLTLGDHKKNAAEMVERGRQKNGKHTRAKSNIRNPYDFGGLLAFIQNNCVISQKNEFLYEGALTRTGYVKLTINYKSYLLHRLVLANKLGKKYEDIDIACHRLPDGTKPQRHDLNPEHLFEGDYSINTLDTITYSNSFKLSKTTVDIIQNEAKDCDFSKRGNRKEFDTKWAEFYQVAPATIADIRRGVSWQTT